MAAQAQLNGAWNEIKGKVKQQWANVTEDDWKRCEGNLEEFVGLVQQKTGEAHDEILRSLKQWLNTSNSYLTEVSESASQFASEAVDQAKAKYAVAEQLVRRKPAESVVVAFGTGVLLGVIVGLVSSRGR